MKRVIFLLLLSMLPGLLYAETVMLFTRMQPPGSGKGANIDRFIAVEDGVEQQFYSAGHIIFDAGVPRATERGTAPRSNGWARRVAMKGGASYLLIVNLTFPNAKKSEKLPSSASYRFMNIKTGALLAKGTVNPGGVTATAKSKKKPYDLCFALGQQIAEKAMNRWKPRS